MPSPTKNQNRLIPFLIILVGLIGGYVYYSNSYSEEPFPLPVNIQKSTLESFRDLIIDFSILDDAVYRSLRVFGELPVTPGVSGKSDSFSPF